MSDHPPGTEPAPLPTTEKVKSFPPCPGVYLVMDGAGVASVDILEGIGFIPRDPNLETRQVYTIADSSLCLVDPAEITLGGMNKDRILDKLDLPAKSVSLFHCFRTEAGAPGRDTRGLHRVHQFIKTVWPRTTTKGSASRLR